MIRTARRAAFRGRRPLFDHDQAHDDVALDRIGDRDGRRLGHERVRDQRAFKLRGTDPFTRHVDRVVAAPADVPVFGQPGPAGSATRPVAVHPQPGDPLPICGQVALVVTFVRALPEAVGAADPRLAHHQFADFTAHRLAGRIDDVGDHPGTRPMEAIRDQRQRGQRAHDPAADLRPAGVVDDRRASASDVAQKPQPRLGVPRLAGAAQHSQRRHLVAAWRIVAVGSKRPDRGRARSPNA